VFCDTVVFLLSSKAGGCGLNLVGANHLILFDPGTHYLFTLSFFLQSHSFSYFFFLSFGTKKTGIRPMTYKQWLVFGVLDNRKKSICIGFFVLAQLKAQILLFLFFSTSQRN
jgi:hypothetical protein